MWQQTGSVAPPNCESDSCPLCQTQAQCRYRGYPGYRAPNSFDIHHCPNCDTAHVRPMAAETDLYDLIYKNRDLIPGYRDYAFLTDVITLKARPLDYLAQFSPPYWAARRFLQERCNPFTTRILEVGSGLGYLTYAMFRQGWSVKGIDVSADAVERARKRFGNFYVCSDVGGYAKAFREKYDVVISLECIEHVSRPVEMLRAMAQLVKPEGEIMLTTPNKSKYTQDTLWGTDHPPIHLWWFSETSMKHLARLCALEMQLLDVSQFDEERGLQPGTLQGSPKPRHGTPFFDQRGRPTQWTLRTFAKVGLRSAGLLDKLHRMKERLRPLPRCGQFDPATMPHIGDKRIGQALCPIFRKPTH